MPKLRKQILTSLLLSGQILFSSAALAAPDQLDVIGIVPGVTTMSQVNELSVDSTGGAAWLKIGGYKMPCAGKLSGKIVEVMTCYSGGKLTKESNIEIHETLVKGFTAKFGEPSSSKIMPIRTRAGVEYISNETSWNDSFGNTLTLFSMAGAIDKGMLILESAMANKRSAEENKREDAARKF